MPDKKVLQAKEALDAIIKKARIHLYKPIQIAEILFRHRTGKGINLIDRETYRVQSRKWRDDISAELLGSKCSSSVRFQDNLFDDNAIPPRILKILGDENTRTSGAVEAYIYLRFMERRIQLAKALEYCSSHDKKTFNVRDFINSFWHQPGLRRSIDKVYEIITYALFSTLVDALELKVEISIDSNKMGILREFEDFAKAVMGLDAGNLRLRTDAAIYRVGVTNAADRGLDMYANWGPAIQIKHLSLDPDLARDIVGGISSNHVVIVCKDAEESVIMSIMRQTGLSDRIQGVVTESDLAGWYEKSLRGKYSGQIGAPLLEALSEQLEEEFPSLGGIPDAIAERHYENMKEDGFWL